jgi:hypothetical protein
MNANNPRVGVINTNQGPLHLDQIQIEIVEPPPLANRIARQAAYYTVGAIIEPQEPRYSAICVFVSLFAVFGAGMIMRKCS